MGTSSSRGGTSRIGNTRSPGTGRNTMGMAPGLGALDNLASLTSGNLQSLVGTGNATSLTDFGSALSNRLSQVGLQRIGDVKEQLGGLGMRFSTDAINAIGGVASDIAGQQQLTEAQTGLQLQEGAANRQLQSLFQLLGIPAQLSGLGAQAYQQQLTPLQLALSAGSPTGQAGRSSGKSAGFGFS